MKKNKDKQKDSFSGAIAFLKKKQFGLANIGISNKTSFDWRANGIYLQEKKTKYRMKYSAIEYIWLLLVKELRDFGLPHKSVLNLKEFLLASIDVEQLLLYLREDTDLENNVIKELGDDIGVFTGSDSELKKGLEELGQNIVDSMFTTMIVSTLLREQEYFLMLKKDGSCLIEEKYGVERSTLTPKDDFTNTSCLRIPFKILVSEFLEKEEIEEYNLTDENELDSITQEFDFKLEDGFGEVSTELKNQIEALMTKQNFNEITYRTADGKKVNVCKASGKK